MGVNRGNLGTRHQAAMVLKQAIFQRLSCVMHPASILGVVTCNPADYCPQMVLHEQSYA